MTYTSDSDLKGRQAVTLGQVPWVDALTAHGVDAAEASEIVGSYFGFGETYNLNPDLTLAQAIHETGWFSSVAWKTRRNAAGIGITGPDVPGPQFGSISTGVRAHLEHVCTTAYTQSTCPVNHSAPVDPRHTFHKGIGQVYGLEVAPKWANPGTGYVDAIVAIANQVTGRGTPMPTNDYPTEADIGCPVRIETTDFVGPGRALADIRWFVVHDTEGHYEGDISVLTHGSRNGSVHAIIGREPGQFCASVPITTTAWTAGNDTLGALAVQVELSKSPASGEVGYTDTQYQYLAAFFRWCVQAGMTGVGTDYYWPHPPDADNGPLPDVPGIIGHYGVPDGAGGWGGFAHHTDPGPDFDWARFVALIGTAPPGPAPWPLVDGKPLGPGFYQLYMATAAETEARLREYGLLIHPDHDAYLITDNPDPATNGTLKKIAISGVAATFERQELFWDRGVTPVPFDVRKPLLTEEIRLPDDPVTIAVLHDMALAGVTR